MKCPYCGENCVDEYILELYIKSLKNFKMRKNTAFNGIPIVCEAGSFPHLAKQFFPSEKVLQVFPYYHHG